MRTWRLDSRLRTCTRVSCLRAFRLGWAYRTIFSRGGSCASRTPSPSNLKQTFHFYPLSTLLCFPHYCASCASFVLRHNNLTSVKDLYSSQSAISNKPYKMGFNNALKEQRLGIVILDALLALLLLLPLNVIATAAQVDSVRKSN
jgi:hypothetical protein